MRSKSENFETDIVAMMTPVLEGKPPLKRKVLRRNFDKFTFGYSGMKLCYCGEFTCDGTVIGRVGIGRDVITAALFNVSPSVPVTTIELWCRVLHVLQTSGRHFNLTIKSISATMIAREQYYRSIINGSDS